MDNVSRKTINWTERKKISQNCVEIQRTEVGTGQPEQVNVQIKLPANEFPESAFVAIEAYRRQLSKRFECGSVGNLKIPNPLRLDIFSSDKLPSLRLLVVDRDGHPGRLLGTIEKIQIPGSGRKTVSKNSILLVDIGTLTNETWKVSINPITGPRLIVDKRIRDIRSRIRTDPEVYSFILPSAFQQILMAIAFSGNFYEDDDHSESWIEKWLKFCKHLGVKDDPRDDTVDKDQWMEDCFKKFCRRHKFLPRLLKLEESETHE